jgi:RNA polymerase sigma-70 factor (ECF subfamily)
MTGEDLVRRAQLGEVSAFARLVEQHRRSAYRLALALVGRRWDADDVVQNAFILALEHIRSCQEPRLFRGWLLQIVRNQARTWHARRLRRGACSLAREPEHDGPTPDASAFQFRLLETLNVLGATERDVVLLHDLDGLTHPEIARALQISAGTSRQHLFRARRKLRLRLDRGDAATPGLATSA